MEIRKTAPEQNKFNKEIKIIKKNQTETPELKNTMTVLKNSVESFNSRLDQAEERMIELEEKQFEIQRNKKKKRMQKSEEHLCDLWDTIK